MVCRGAPQGECYTLAMLLRDYRDAVAKMPNIRITASDISEGSIEEGSKRQCIRRGIGAASHRVEGEILPYGE